MQSLFCYASSSLWGNNYLVAGALKELYMFWMIVGYGKTYLDKCSRDHIGAYAAQAAYFLIMSAIPFLMLLFAICNISSPLMDYVNLFVHEILPSEFEPYIDRVMVLVMQSSAGIVFVSAIMALWASGVAFQNLMVGLNVVHDVKIPKNWLSARVYSIFYTMLLFAAMVITMLMLVFADQLQNIFANYNGLIGYLVGIRPFFRYIFLFGFLILVFTFLFKVLPNKELTFLSQLPGGIISALVWYIFSGLLAIWVRWFGAFSMYGALSTIMIFMFWLYFCMYFMLMAAEANVFFKEAFGVAYIRMKNRVKEKYLSNWNKKG